MTSWSCRWKRTAYEVGCAGRRRRRGVDEAVERATRPSSRRHDEPVLGAWCARAGSAQYWAHPVQHPRAVSRRTPLATTSSRRRTRVTPRYRRASPPRRPRVGGAAAARRARTAAGGRGAGRGRAEPLAREDAIAFVRRGRARPALTECGRQPVAVPGRRVGERCLRLRTDVQGTRSPAAADPDGPARRAPREPRRARPAHDSAGGGVVGRPGSRARGATIGIVTNGTVAGRDQRVLEAHRRGRASRRTPASARRRARALGRARGAVGKASAQWLGSPTAVLDAHSSSGIVACNALLTASVRNSTLVPVARYMPRDVRRSTRRLSAQIFSALVDSAGFTADGAIARPERRPMIDAAVSGAEGAGGRDLDARVGFVEHGELERPRPRVIELGEAELAEPRRGHPNGGASRCRAGASRRPRLDKGRHRGAQRKVGGSTDPLPTCESNVLDRPPRRTTDEAAPRSAASTARLRVEEPRTRGKLAGSLSALALAHHGRARAPPCCRAPRPVRRDRARPRSRRSWPRARRRGAPRRPTKSEDRAARRSRS